MLPIPSCLAETVTGYRSYLNFRFGAYDRASFVSTGNSLHMGNP